MRGGWVRATARWHYGVWLIIGVTGTALLTACGNAQPAQSGGGIPVPPVPGVSATASSASATAPSAAASIPGSALSSAVVIRVSLDQARVVAGQPIHGQAVVTNTTTKPVLIHACAAEGWVMVGLTNGRIPYHPAITYSLCAPSPLAPGPHRYPVTVATTYPACLGPGGKSLIPVHIPTCAPNGRPPPLPAGTYITKVVAPGLPAGTPVAPPVTVTLLPPSGSR